MVLYVNKSYELRIYNTDAKPNYALAYGTKELSRKMGIRVSQLWERLIWSKQLNCAGEPVPKVKSLHGLYQRYRAANFGLTNSISLDLGPGHSLRNPFDCD
jgi:hypothetical protein